MQNKNRKLQKATKNTVPDVGKYLTSDPRVIAGSVWPCVNLRVFTSVLSSSRDD